MRLLLYIGRSALAAPIIRLRTGSNIVHAAMLFGLGADATVIEAAPGAGVISYAADDYFNRWPRTDFLNFPLFTTPEAEADSHAFALAQIGKPYDWAGALFGYHTGTDQDRVECGRWFCSELATVLARKAGINLISPDVPAWTVWPRDLRLSPLLPRLG